MSEKRTLPHWEGFSRMDFKDYPVPVQKDMGVALFVVQLGQTPETAKPLNDLGSGVHALEDHRENTFRAVYTVRWAMQCVCCVRFRRSRSPASRRRRRMRS